MASSLLQKLAQEDAERVTLLSIEKAELDQRNLIHQAYKEGYQIAMNAMLSLKKTE